MLDKAEYSAFESTLNSFKLFYRIVSYRIVLCKFKRCNITGLQNGQKSFYVIVNIALQCGFLLLRSSSLFAWVVGQMWLNYCGGVSRMWQSVTRGGRGLKIAKRRDVIIDWPLYRFLVEIRPLYIQHRMYSYLRQTYHRAVTQLIIKQTIYYRRL